MNNCPCTNCLFYSVYRDMGATVPVCLFNQVRSLSSDAKRCDVAIERGFCKNFVCLDLVRGYYRFKECVFDEKEND